MSYQICYVLQKISTATNSYVYQQYPTDMSRAKKEDLKRQ